MFKHYPYFLSPLLVAWSTLLGSSAPESFFRSKKIVMKEKDQRDTDRHLNAPLESNREKHINFREVEEESSENFMINKTLQIGKRNGKKGLKKVSRKGKIKVIVHHLTCPWIVMIH